MFYAKYPTDLATDGSAAATSVDVPNGWEDVLEDYVEYRYHLKDRNPGEAQRAKQQYDENLLKLIGATTSYVDAPGQITMDVVPFDSFGWGF